jgi:hypothetical protein
MAGIGTMFIGIIFLLFSIPLLKRKVPMNRMFGFWFPQALTSTENWYAINAYGARRMMLWSLAMIFIGLVSIFTQLLAVRALQLILSLAPLLVLVPIIECYLYARKMQ